MCIALPIGESPKPNTVFKKNFIQINAIKLLDYIISEKNYNLYLKENIYHSLKFEIY